MQTQLYWAEVRKQQAALTDQYPEGYCHIISVANRDRGTVDENVTAVANDNAARCLVEQTHRLATQEEIAAWLDHQNRNRQAAKSNEWLLRGTSVVWGGK